MMIWFQKTFHDSRFDAGNDLYHKVYEFFLMVVLATAVLYIRPVSYLSTPSTNEDIFVFSTCITIASFMAMGRNVDVIRNVDGEPAAKRQAFFEIKIFASMTVFYLAATIVSATDYFGSTDNSYGTNNDAANSVGGDYGDTNHLPIIFLLVGANMYTVGIFYMIFRSEFNKNFDPKE